MRVRVDVLAAAMNFCSPLSSWSFKNGSGKWLGKEVSHRLLAGDMRRCSETSLEVITNHMTIHLKVFCAFMKREVGSDVNCWLVVTPEWNGSMQRYVKILQQV